MVMTETDLLDFLAAVVAHDPRTPLSGTFSRRETTFLFLGFGLHRWHLRLLLYALKANNRNRSFALEGRRTTTSDQVAMFYQNGYRICLLDQDIDPFIFELAQRVGPRKPSDIPSDPPESTEGPRVFVSYSHEDVDFAEQVVASLNRGKVKAWMDRRRLAIGDAFGDVIREEIAGSDYFVIVQSRTLAARSQSYVYRELAIAEEVQASFRPGLKFILPVVRGKLDKTELAKVVLAPLVNLHVEQIETADEIAGLALQIRRDFVRRKQLSSWT